MPTGRATRTASFPGYSFADQASAVSFDNFNAYEVTLPAVAAADTGTLDTRTDDDTGTVGLASGHTIVTSDVCDVYWDGGVRYGMTATVTGDDAALDGGAGDVLPIATTSCTVVKQTEINPLNLDGDNAQLVGVFYRNASDQTAKAHIDLQDSGSASIAEHDVVHETANGGLSEVTNISAGDTNIYTGNPITKGFASHDSAYAATIYILAGIDSTP